MSTTQLDYLTFTPQSGIENLGNSCFVNAALQTIRNVRELFDSTNTYNDTNNFVVKLFISLDKDKYNTQINTTNIAESCKLHKFDVKIQDDPMLYITTVLIQNYEKYHHEGIKKLNSLLGFNFIENKKYYDGEKCYDVIRKINNFKINNLKISKEIILSINIEKNPYAVIEKQKDLEAEIEKQKDPKAEIKKLSDIIKEKINNTSYSDSKNVYDFKLSTINKNNKIENINGRHKFCIVEEFDIFPKYILISLKIFKFDNRIASKLNIGIEIDNEIIFETKTYKYTYKPISVAYHRGSSINSGHHFNYSYGYFEKDKKLSGPLWVELNDSTVNEFEGNNIKDINNKINNIGDKYNHTPYLILLKLFEKELVNNSKKLDNLSINTNNIELKFYSDLCFIEIKDHELIQKLNTINSPYIIICEDGDYSETNIVKSTIQKIFFKYFKPSQIINFELIISSDGFKYIEGELYDSIFNLIQDIFEFKSKQHGINKKLFYELKISNVPLIEFDDEIDINNIEQLLKTDENILKALDKEKVKNYVDQLISKNIEITNVNDSKMRSNIVKLALKLSDYL
jgi:hypothetical protein